MLENWTTPIELRQINLYIIDLTIVQIQLRVEPKMQLQIKMKFHKHIKLMNDSKTHHTQGTTLKTLWSQIIFNMPNNRQNNKIYIYV